MSHKSEQRRGLGRGLGSLIPTGPQPSAFTRRFPAQPGSAPDVEPTAGTPQTPSDAAAEAPVAAEAPGKDGQGGENGVEHAGAAEVGQAGAYFTELPVAQIAPNPRQPRQVFDEEAMADLVVSVQEVGLLQPVVVRPVPVSGDTGDGTGGPGGPAFELVMGERRWRAVQTAGLHTIPAIVRETGDDALLRDALLENLHRAELNPLEEAAAYQQLLDDFGCTHDELASQIGRSRPQISNTLRLLRLSPAVQRRVAAGVVSAGHARALLSVEDADVQDRLADRIVAEGISVRGIEEIIAVGDLGSEPAANGAARARTNRATAPGLAELAARLSERLDTRVKVDLGKRKGRISVEFASIPDLERIVAILDPKDDKPI